MAAGVAAFLLDQATKRAATWAGARVVENRRGALIGLPPSVAVVVLVVIGVVAVVLAGLGGSTTAIGLGLLVGGAGGNVVDRVRRGAVVDFVAAGRWPVFNLADAAMVVGAVVAIGGSV